MEKNYRETAQILQKASRKLGSIRTLVYESQLKNKPLLLRLCCETAKHRAYLQRLLAGAGGAKLLKSAPIRGDRHLALVVLYELVLGQGFRNSSKCSKALVEAVDRVAKIVHKEVEKLAQNGITAKSMAVESSASKIPRYARINTLKLSMDEAVGHLQASGFVVQLLRADISPKNFRKKVAKMEPKKVYVDAHVDNLLVFAPGTDLHAFWMVNEGFVLQDKASCLPSFVLGLGPSTNAHVMDVCAAPGMKTTHLAALMNNGGKIFAFDRDSGRLKTLREMLQKCGVRNAIASNADFLRVDVNDQRYSQVEYALVDPPCSGSGMAKRGEFLDESDAPDQKRLRSLANLQSMILKHALRLPNLQRCVYSTCSVHDAENEGVVEEVLGDEAISSRYELVDDPLPGWTHRGVDGFEFARKCLRASPDVDLTNGFFVVVFQRKTG